LGLWPAFSVRFVEREQSRKSPSWTFTLDGMSGHMYVLAVAGVMGLTVGVVLRVLHSRPLKQILRARSDFQKIVRQHLPHAEVTVWGGRDVYPVFWIKTSRDDERDQLRRDQLAPDSKIMGDFRRILFRVGYPATDVPLAQVVAESQETVDRDYKGSWGERQKDWFMRRYN